MASQESSPRQGAYAARIRIGWGDVPLVLGFLEEKAKAAYLPGPIGNAVCIDFASEADALLILEAFPHARRIVPD
ncbi:MAG: hypothetical protein EOO76_19255 [Novosphingobium sp.]|nr:MAG: hypothetical protein EOO76_19255 [Novosphingobium sp.]